MRNVWMACLLLLAACNESTEEIKTFYPDGKTVKETYAVLENDSTRRHGMYTLFYENGTIARQLEFNQGLPWKLIKQQTKDGKVLDTNTLKEGNGTLTTYSPQGDRLAEHTYRNGYLVGPTRFYDLAGNEIITLDYTGGVPTFPDSLIDKGFNFDSFGGDSVTQLQPLPGGQVSLKFNPAQADAVMRQFKLENYSKMYALLLPEARQAYSQAQYNRYMNFLKELYGAVRSYKRIDAQQGQVKGMGEVAQAIYEVKFSGATGGVMLTFFRSGNGYRFSDIQVQLNPYTPVQKVKQYGDPIMEKLKAQDWQALYDMSNALLQAEVNFAQFKEKLAVPFEQLGKIQDFDLFNHQPALEGEKLALLAIYEVKLADGRETMAEMVLLEDGKAFKFVSLTAADPAQLQQMQQQMQQMQPQGGLPQ